MGNNIIIEGSGKGGIILYQTPDGQTSLEVKLENETVWLTRQQMAMLFGRDVKTIGKHINNALREELAGESVVAKFATPKKYGRREGFEQTQYPEYYSLEMITSVGYRVKSRNGIIFRRWANSVLKDYLIKGYAVKNSLIQELRRTDLPDLGRAGPLPSIEEKADVLLYLVTKNHSFTDGNKRIAATLFLWFMENNGILYAPDGSKRIADNALVALTLMIAESKADEMDMMVKVIVNLINKSN